MGKPHALLVPNLAQGQPWCQSNIHGVDSAEDRNDMGKISDAIFEVMSAKLEELIKNLMEMSRREDEDMTSSLLAGRSCSLGLSLQQPKLT
ncbi:hypothetical protein Tco_0165374 [Tanacetum coccineum]